MRYYHPIIIFSYFIGLITVSVFFWNPVFLLISFLAGAFYLFLIKGRAGFRLFLLTILTMALVILLNPLLNHQGLTVLGYLGNNPVTLEALLYGLGAALMTGSVMLWSICLQASLTSEMLMAVFGRVLPTFTLIFSMILHFLPGLRVQAGKIARAQKGMGQPKTLRSHLGMLSILLTWTLENGVITADAMAARGFGLTRRTSFTHYRFRWRDAGLGGALLICLALSVAGMVRVKFYYFPDISMRPVDALAVLSYFAYGLYCLVPSLFDLREVILWRSYRRGG